MLSIFLSLGLLSLPIIWLLTDPRPIQERLKQYLKIKGIVLVAIEFVVVFFNLYYSNTLNLNNTFSNIAISIGILLYLVGLIIAIWAKITMGRVWGSPAEHNIKTQNKLIKAGPFKFSRNPIYLGLILTFLGYSLALKSIFIIFNMVVIGYFYYSALKEEKLLEKHFRKEYLEYKSSVPRFMLWTL